MNPEVSVVIAARNEELHVVEAVQSILAQRGVRHELIFVDDNSTDATIERATAAASGSDNATIVRSPGRGKVTAFNHGVSLARGTWTCLFSGDDIMPAGSLEARWRAVKDIQSRRPVVGLCRMVTMSEVKSQDGHIIPKSPKKGSYSGSFHLMDPQVRAAVFPVPETLPNEDTWMELAARHFDFEVVHSPIIGCQWRIHAGNSVNMLVPFDDFNARYTPRMAAAAMFLDRYGARLTPESRARLEARVACEQARVAGNLPGILGSRVPLVDKLRAVSLSGPMLYEVRRRLYGLMSGW